MTETPIYFLIAGEASGDLLGARLMQALRKITNNNARFMGIGGSRMRAEGIELLFPQEELAHMGFIDVLRHLPNIMRRINETAAAVKKNHPAALITIDSPDFSFRVAKKLKGADIPLIHYVAPTVWAWRAGRAKKVAKFLDHLLALLPFEPPYFTREGLGCTFVGHSIVESGAAHGDAARFYAAHNIPDDAVLLTLLPGSRVGEITRLMPVFGEVVRQLHAVCPTLQAVLPTVPNLRDRLCGMVADWPVPVTLIEGDADKYDAFAASRAALACSGTVALELALAKLPAVVAYKASPLSFAIARRFLKIKYASLVNLMHDKMVVPECIQEDCTPEKIVPLLRGLLTDDLVRQRQLDGLGDVAGWLGQGQFVPSEQAAKTVLAVVRNYRLKKNLPSRTGIGTAPL